MEDTAKILIWNRTANREEVERVYGDALVRWLYGTATGQKTADWFLSRKWLSAAYGAYQGSSMSRHKVEPFINDFSIPMEEYEGAPFSSFNDFFIRKFRPGARQFVSDSGRMAAFAEARYFAYEAITDEQVFPVKGKWLSAAALMGDASKAAPFVGGPLLLARLCPVDYHRYHYPDNGRTLEHYPVRGLYHSVNPHALQYKGDIFATNERRVAILETENFGKLAYIEVGAMMVGKIVQTHPEDQPFNRGDEKGYFLFGGSTVIVLGEPGRWTPDPDLIEQTRKHRETLVRLGDPVAQIRRK